jgi:cytochrome c556
MRRRQGTQESGGMAAMADNERPIDAERVTDALRRFVFAPGEEPTEVHN